MFIGYYVTVALAFVPSAENGHLELWLQQLDEILDVGSLASTANGDVAHRHHRNLEAATFQDSYIEQ
jgi:hypothetical protein